MALLASAPLRASAMALLYFVSTSHLCKIDYLL
jgi:hypothetical protein